jgi:hypothetical protein
VALGFLGVGVEIGHPLAVGAARALVQDVARAGLAQAHPFVAGECQHVDLFVGPLDQPCEQPHPARVGDAYACSVTLDAPLGPLHHHSHGRGAWRALLLRAVAQDSGPGGEARHPDLACDLQATARQVSRLGGAPGARDDLGQLVRHLRNPWRMASLDRMRERLAEVPLGIDQIAESRVEQAAQARDRPLVDERDLAADLRRRHALDEVSVAAAIGFGARERGGLGQERHVGGIAVEGGRLQAEECPAGDGSARRPRCARTPPSAR